MFIFLDDYRVPNDVKWVRLPFAADWVIVRNYSEFLALIKDMKEPPTFVAFDHDLADAHYNGDFTTGELTGLDCAKAMVDIGVENGWTHWPEFVVHSLNPVGRVNIQNCLMDARNLLNGKSDS